MFTGHDASIRSAAETIGLANGLLRAAYSPPKKQPSWREMGIEVEDSEEAEARRRGEQRLRPPVKKKSAAELIRMAEVADLVAHDHDNDKTYYNRWPPLALDQFYE